MCSLPSSKTVTSGYDSLRKINDEGKEDVLFVYNLLDVYKIKFKLVFRWEIETNGNEKRKLIHLFWRGRYK